MSNSIERVHMRRQQLRNVGDFDSSLPRGDSRVTIFHAPVYERRKNIINRFRICKWLAAVVKHMREEIWQSPEWIFDYLYSALSGARACALENCPNYRSHRRPSPKSLITEGCAAKRERGPVMNGHCTCPSSE